MNRKKTISIVLSTVFCLVFAIYGGQATAVNYGEGIDEYAGTWQLEMDGDAAVYNGNVTFDENGMLSGYSGGGFWGSIYEDLDDVNKTNFNWGRYDADTYGNAMDFMLTGTWLDANESEIAGTYTMFDSAGLTVTGNFVMKLTIPYANIIPNPGDNPEPTPAGDPVPTPTDNPTPPPTDDPTPTPTDEPNDHVRPDGEGLLVWTDKTQVEIGSEFTIEVAVKPVSGSSGGGINIGDPADAYLFLESSDATLKLFFVFDAWGNIGFSDQSIPLVSSWPIETFDFMPIVTVEVPEDENVIGTYGINAILIPAFANVGDYAQNVNTVYVEVTEIGGTSDEPEPTPTPEPVELSFGTSTAYSVQGGPKKLAVEKLDGTNYDIVVSLQDSDRIKILRNDGTGAFETSNAYDTGNGVFDVNAGDLDGDGHLDLVTTNAYGGFAGGGQSMSIFFNDGTGSYGTATTIDLTEEPYTTAIADFNNDGNNDILLSLAIWDLELFTLNNGIVSTNTSRIDGGEKGREIVAGDFNKDGKIDFAAVYYDTFEVMIYSNNNGVFSSPQTKNIGGGPTSMAGGDLNGDDAIDLAVNDTLSQKVFIIKNFGSGVFDDPIAVDMPAVIQDLSIGDLDGDGKSEIVCVGGDSVYILRTGADGLFIVDKTIAVSGNLLDVKLADVDGDNKLDIVALSGQSETVNVLINNTPDQPTATTEPTDQPAE